MYEMKDEVVKELEYRNNDSNNSADNWKRREEDLV